LSNVVSGKKLRLVQTENVPPSRADTHTPTTAWDLPSEQKVSLLKEWISAKVRSIFEVLSVSEE
jgi:hypothetical protein